MDLKYWFELNSFMREKETAEQKNKNSKNDQKKSLVVII